MRERERERERGILSTNEWDGTNGLHSGMQSNTHNDIHGPPAHTARHTITLGSRVSPFFTTISIERAFFRNIVLSPVKICFSAAEKLE